jgi:hypothetical protein
MMYVSPPVTQYLEQTLTTTRTRVHIIHDHLSYTSESILQEFAIRTTHLLTCYRTTRLLLAL